VYSQEKLLRYALAFDGVPPDVRGRFCEGDILDGDVFTFTSISSSSNDSIVGKLSFRTFMLAADQWRQFGGSMEQQQVQTLKMMMAHRVVIVKKGKVFRL
jgi:hypothetical protein